MQQAAAQSISVKTLALDMKQEGNNSFLFVFLTAARAGWSSAGSPW